MSLSFDSSYYSALTKAAAAFTIRITLTHVLTARERILCEQFVHEKDSSNCLLPFLRAVLVCVPGTELGGAAFIHRCERIGKNCAENEPFFLALATVGGLSGAVPAGLGTALIETYTVARFSHFLVYFLGDNSYVSFLRPVAFATGAVTTLVLAGAALGLAPTSSK